MDNRSLAGAAHVWLANKKENIIIKTNQIADKKLCTVLIQNKSKHINNLFTNILYATSVASFLVWGGGARPPNVPTKIIYVLILRERAPQKHIFSGLKYICIQCHIQSMRFPLITYGQRRRSWRGGGQTYRFAPPPPNNFDN